MGKTTNGVPWPEPTAPVRDGATDMRSMAEFTDGKLIRGGLLDGTTDGGGWIDIPMSPAPKQIVFTQIGDLQFSPWIPHQQVTVHGIYPTFVSVRVMSLTTEAPASATRVTACWIAFGAQGA
jgi:hypothetical protein